MRRVVVFVKERHYRHKVKGTVAATYDSMGLVAYGKTRDEASSNLKRLFDEDIAYHREHDTLEAYLNRLDLRWVWDDEFLKTPEYEGGDYIPLRPRQREAKFAAA